MNGNHRDEHGSVEDAFLELFKKLLGSKSESRAHVNNDLVRIGKVVSQKDREWLCLPFGIEDVKTSM